MSVTVYKLRRTLFASRSNLRGSLKDERNHIVREAVCGEARFGMRLYTAPEAAFVT